MLCKNDPPTIHDARDLNLNRSMEQPSIEYQSEPHVERSDRMRLQPYQPMTENSSRGSQTRSESPKFEKREARKLSVKDKLSARAELEIERGMKNYHATEKRSERNGSTLSMPEVIKEFRESEQTTLQGTERKTIQETKSAKQMTALSNKVSVDLKIKRG